MQQSGAHTHSILVVDDNAWMQRILAKILMSYGLKPLLASNGYEAIALAVECKPLAVILDIIMPDLSGHQTLRLLKSIPSTRAIPVVMITVASDAENLSQAIKIGASGFIRKPFTRATIYDKLKDVIGAEALLESEKHASHLTAEIEDSIGVPPGLHQPHGINDSALGMPLTPELIDELPANAQPIHATPIMVSKRNLKQLYKEDTAPSSDVVRELLSKSIR